MGKWTLDPSLDISSCTNGLPTFPLSYASLARAPAAPCAPHPSELSAHGVVPPASSLASPHCLGSSQRAGAVSDLLISLFPEPSTVPGTW